MADEKPLDVIAVGAHPDDVEIACGGTLAKLVRQGYRVGIVDLTDGEPTPNSPGPEARAAEAEAARQKLGVHVRVQLDLPNRRLFDSFEARVALAKVFRRYRPRLVFGFGEKTPLASPDHYQAMQITDAGVFYSRLTKWDQHFDGLPVHTISAYLYYTLAFTSFGIPPGAGTLVVDIADTLEAKLEAIRCYETQFGAKPEKQIEQRVRAFAVQLGTCRRFCRRRNVFQPTLDRHARFDALFVRPKTGRSTGAAGTAAVRRVKNAQCKCRVRFSLNQRTNAFAVICICILHFDFICRRCFLPKFAFRCDRLPAPPSFSLDFPPAPSVRTGTGWAPSAAVCPISCGEGQRHCQAVFCSGHADIAQAAFFVDGVRIAMLFGIDRFYVRQQSLFHADQINVRKLQSLGRVQRHQSHGVAIQLRFFVAGFVALAQRHFVKKRPQRWFLRPFFVRPQRIDQFLHAAHAIVVRWLGILSCQIVLITDSRDQFIRQGN